MSPSFNLHDYPKYILGIKALNGLTEKEMRLFSNSLKEIQYTYDGQGATQYHGGGRVNYIMCGSGSCLSFTVKAENKEQILMLTATNVPQEKFIKIVKGI